MIRDAMRDFAQERLALRRRWDRHHTFPAEALKELGELGAMGVTVPPSEWDGAGMDHMSLVLMLEEIAAGDGATSTIVSVQNSPCGITMKYGSDEQKEKYLKPLARGDMLGCFCLTEPHTGSDASAITTRRRATATISCSTASSSSSPPASMRRWRSSSRSPTRAAGKKGISGFLVPTETPGYIVARIEEKDGQHASDTGADHLRELPHSRLPPARQEGDGYRIALSNLEAGRIGIAAQSVGMARSALDAAA